MEKIIFVILFSCFSLTIISCSDDKEEYSATVTSDNTTTTDNTTTDTTAPTVSSIKPNNSSNFIAKNPNIIIEFSEAMDTTSVTTNTSNTSCSGSVQLSSDNFSNCIQMSNSPSASNSNKTFSISPASLLANSTTYKIRISTSAKDTSSNSIANQYTQTNGFQTGSPNQLAGAIQGFNLNLSGTVYMIMHLLMGY